jgi:hypothetical protein
MIVESLIGVCFFAAIVAMLSVPWMSVSDHIDDPEH